MTKFFVYEANQQKDQYLTNNTDMQTYSNIHANVRSDRLTDHPCQFLNNEEITIYGCLMLKNFL